LPMLGSTIAALNVLSEQSGTAEVVKVAAAVGAERRHPLHALAMVTWFGIQVILQAIFTCVTCEETPVTSHLHKHTGIRNMSYRYSIQI
jgi:hypothetical protein